MTRIKIDYGIDLGTTNSAIARMENGESVIKQTKNLMDTLPSCVYFSRNKKGERALRIGMKAKDSVYSDAIMALSKNEIPKECGYLEFKREMGSGKLYSNENMPKPTYTPEELSAEVLKELKSLINDETINSVVITVPAMFTAIQKDATMRAAKIAGFKQWCSDRTSVDAAGNVIEAFLIEGKPNTFKIKAYDQQGNTVDTFPSDFTIIQGVKVGAAPLPYNIGIAVYNDVKKRGVFLPAKGLEKNKPLPAVGVVPDRKTTQALRPGVSTDVLSIPVYQVSGLEAEGKTAALYTKISEVVVNGDEVDQLIPENSIVEITLHADSSEMMTMEVYFPSVDLTVKKELDLSRRESPEDAVSWVKKELGSAQRSIESLSLSGIYVEELNKELNAVKELASNGNDPMRAQSDLKKLLCKIEELDDNTEWERVEKELREEFDRLEKAQNELGSDKTAQLVSQIRSQVDNVIRVQDAKLGREVLDQINSLFVHLTLVYQCMALIRDCHNRFGAICWKDSSRARQLINRGLEEMNNQPSVDRLHPIACGIIDLMPNEEAVNAGGLLK